MTQANHTFSVNTRSILGKKVKQLRSQGMVVGSISIPNKETKHIQGDYREFAKLMDSAGEGGLFYLNVDDKKAAVPVLIDEIQLDPISQEMMHVTFRKVSLTEKVESDIEIEFVGEPEVSNGVLVTVLDNVTIEALPTDLPENFQIDLSKITEIGQSITLADLEFDSSKISLVLGEDQDPSEMPIVIYQEQSTEEESEEDETPTEPEITGGAGDSKESSEENSEQKSE